MTHIAFGLLFSAGAILVILARRGVLDRRRSVDPLLAGIDIDFVPLGSGTAANAASADRKKGEQHSAVRIPEPIAIVQVVAAIGGLMVGWLSTGLVGLGVLLAGLGALIPPFMAAPKRRRSQNQRALAWQMWSRQLAELAQSGAGLADALKGSVAHAPPELADIVSGVATTAELEGLEAAFEELASSGTAWEPEVAAGLRMAATTGGPVADPLFDLCGRIGEVVELHRTKTEAVVQLWTQTIALLVLATGVIVLLYSNNPAYFEPYHTGAGQLMLIGIAGVLLLSVAFLVYHSVVRDERSVLVATTRRKEVKEPW